MENEQKNLEVKAITEIQQKDWDAFVDSNPNSLICHSFQWINFVKKFYNLRLFPLACFLNGNIDGVLPIFSVKTFPPREKLISVPYFVAGGAAANSMESLKSLVCHAVKLAEQMHCPLVLKQYKHVLPGDFNVDSNFYNRELNLTDSLEGIWENLHEDNKHNIKKAESLNISVKFPYENVDIFYKIFSSFHKKNGIPCVSKAWIERMLDTGAYYLAIVEREKTPVGATMVQTFKKTVSFPFSCHINNGHEAEEAYMYFLYWELIKYFSENRFSTFNSGRIPRDFSTYRFRLGWGGEKNNYQYHYYPSTVKKTEFKVKRNMKRKLFEAVWKTMPIGMVEWLGPKVVKHFP